MAEAKERQDRWTAARGSKDERRDAIVATAQEVFFEKGYAGTSMAAIAARYKGAKGTLYNYFKSKEDLFAAVVERKADDFLRALVEVESEGGALAATLVHLGERILELILSEDYLATYRLITGECARFPEIGNKFYAAGPVRRREEMSKFFAQAKEAGQLKADTDTDLAADQLFSLFIADIHQSRLWMVASMPSREDIHRRAEAAVGIFLQAYGV